MAWFKTGGYQMIWYIMGFASFATWTVLLFTGTVLGGWVHLLLAIAIISVIGAVIKDQRELMP
jgi:mannose/fructose/N-acetylgalactosamine-specific phosphotransferase system component IIC